MKRLGIVLRIVLAVALAQLGWTWLQRHDSDLRLRSLLAGRSAHGSAALDTGTSVKIDQFYPRATEITDGENDLVCYGVRNARSVRVRPAVADLTPALVRCFFVQPREDTTYRLVVEGNDGSSAEAAFEIKVRPAPPVFRMMAVSDKAVPAGEVVTVCYSVEHATAVRLDPIGWRLPTGAKNCIRFYPKQTQNYTLVASGAAGLEGRERFRVAVNQAAP
jgi:hypothetical protein